MTWHTLRLLQQTESAFLRLPAELRSLIYGFATESLKPVELFITTKNEWKSAKSATPVGLLRACKQTRSEAHDLVWDALQFTITLNRFGFQCVKPTGKGKTGTIGGCTFLQKAKAIRVVVPPSRCQPSQRDDESTTERLEALFGALVKSTELNVVEVQCEKEGVHKYLGSNEVSRACWIFVRELQEGGVQARTL